MSFDHKKIKEIKISVNNGFWTAEKYNLVLTLDPRSKSNLL